jgi:hypothetical protein
MLHQKLGEIREWNDNTVAAIVAFPSSEAWHERPEHRLSLAGRLKRFRFSDLSPYLYAWPIGGFVAYQFGWGHAAVIAAALSAAVADGRRSSKRLKLPPAEVQALIDSPAEVPQFPVQLEFVKGHVVYGSDQGVLAVMDGGIHFSGLRTEFTLTSRLSSVLRDLDKAGSLETFSIRFRTDEFEGVIRVSVYERTSPGGPLVRSALLEALRAWERAPASERWANVIGPPTTAQPAEIRRLLRKARVAGWNAALCLVASQVVRLPWFAQFHQDHLPWPFLFFAILFFVARIWNLGETDKLKTLGKTVRPQPRSPSPFQLGSNGQTEGA